MEFIKEDWLVPPLIKTPDIEKDILQYLGNEILEKWKSSNDMSVKETITFVTERLDFISHLNAFKNYAINKSNEEFTDDNNGLKWKVYKFLFDGHDCSGVQFDIEALVLYLLLTCIDAIQSQPEYCSAFEWLQKNVDKYENLTKEQIVELLKNDKEQYEELFGLSKNFRLAFTDRISKNLIEQIAENLIVAKFDGNEINKASFATWVSKDKTERIKKIANYLYNLRSKYTHKNIRSFIPQKKIGTRTLKGEYLLCMKGFSLENKLIEVIKELCLSKFH